MQVVFDLIRTLVAPAAQVLAALTAAYLLTLWLTLIIWTFRDIEGRSRSVITQVFATLLVVFFFLPGALLYLILRPKETLDEAFQRALQEEYLLQDLEELPLCPNCRHYMQADFVLCPYCHTRLRENCPSCERLVELRWSVCPYCTTGLPSPGEDEVTTEAETLPPLRLPEWVSPALQRLRARVLARGMDKDAPALGPGRARPAAAIGAPASAGETPVASGAEQQRRSVAVEASLVEPEAVMTTAMNGHHDEVEPEVAAPARPRGRRRRGNASAPADEPTGDQSMPSPDVAPADERVGSRQ